MAAVRVALARARRRRLGTGPGANAAHFASLTVLGALAAEGVVGAISVQAATSSAVFCAYLEQVLLPALRRSKPGAVLIMDPRKPLRDFADLAAHKTAQVRALLDSSGFAYRYLPAYSPTHDKRPLAIFARTPSSLLGPR